MSSSTINSGTNNSRTSDISSLPTGSRSTTIDNTNINGHHFEESDPNGPVKTHVYRDEFLDSLNTAVSKTKGFVQLVVSRTDYEMTSESSIPLRSRLWKLSLHTHAMTESEDPSTLVVTQEISTVLKRERESGQDCFWDFPWDKGIDHETNNLIKLLETGVKCSRDPGLSSYAKSSYGTLSTVPFGNFTEVLRWTDGGSESFSIISILVSQTAPGENLPRSDVLNKYTMVPFF
ncbi:hypothetical protein BCR39DRAFT_557753 [Naematelia encephala]|uniref:Uncharacterized protein n=1 Tax=Naematelia encephala TaxID=71784 RepID=A0A1Y2BBL2_9TREE|nr:hypothetical protein BCR39DRAFT_557753 [Naematelia encephala]